jgi:hypothetical protein
MADVIDRHVGQCLDVGIGDRPLGRTRTASPVSEIGFELRQPPMKPSALARQRARNRGATRELRHFRDRGRHVEGMTWSIAMPLASPGCRSATVDSACAQECTAPRSF